MDYQGYPSNDPYLQSSQKYQQPQSSKTYQSQQGNYTNQHQGNYSKHYQPQHENNLYRNQQSQRNYLDSYQSQKVDYPREFTTQVRYNENSGGGSSYSEGLYQRRTDTNFASPSSFRDRDNLNRDSYQRRRDTNFASLSSFRDSDNPNRDSYRCRSDTNVASPSSFRDSDNLNRDSYQRRSDTNFASPSSYRDSNNLNRDPYQRKSDADFPSPPSFRDSDNLNPNTSHERSRPYGDRYKPYDLGSKGISESRGNFNQQGLQSRDRGSSFIGNNLRGSQQYSRQTATSRDNTNFGGVQQELKSEVKLNPEESDFDEHDDLEDNFDGEEEEEEDFGLYDDTTFGEKGNDDIGSQEGFKKIDLYTPEPSIVEKHLVYPPSVEELREMLSDLVIFFLYRNKNMIERNHFVVLCESFRRSSRYSDLNVEDGFHVMDKFRKYATLTWHGMIMARGASEYGNFKEPRVRASVELINKLAQFCYTLKAKDSYFKNEALQYLLDTKEMPGVFKVVPQDQLRNELEVDKYMDNFFMNDTDSELIFTEQKLVAPVLDYARNKGFTVRKPRKEFVAVCKTRTPQYWRDKILASGQMENEKYHLIPPQGLGKDLLEDFDILESVPILSKHILPPIQNSKKKQPKKKALRTTTTPVPQLYGPKGVGPTIIQAKPPWRTQPVRRKGKKYYNKRRNVFKKNKNKKKFKKNKNYPKFKKNNNQTEFKFV